MDSKSNDAQGNILALQGPMGNGKTTLIKEGVAKALDGSFAFVSLGGASDSWCFKVTVILMKDLRGVR